MWMYQVQRHALFVIMLGILFHILDIKTSLDSASRNPRVNSVYNEPSNSLYPTKDFHPAFARLEKYAKWQRKVLSARPSESTRFLVFHPRRTGIGNVVEAMLSSLLFALLTDRVFLIEWEPNLTRKGYHLTTDYSSKKFVYKRRKKTASYQSSSSLRQLLNIPIEEEFIDLSHPNIQRHYMLANYESSVYMITEPNSDWACSDIKSMDHPLQKYKILGLNTNMYFANLFVINPFLHSALLSFSRIKNGQNKNTYIKKDVNVLQNKNPFAPLFRWFIVPNELLLRKIMSVKEALRVNRTVQKVIGVHIRMYESFAKDKDLPYWWRCLDKMIEESQLDHDEISIFLASNSEAVIRIAIEKYGDIVKHISHITFISAEVSNRKIRDGKHAVAQALVDLFLLIQSDELLVTGGSSYSRLAYGAADTLPWYVTVRSKLWNTRSKPNQCLKALSSQPCSLRNIKALFERNACISKSVANDLYKACSMT